MCDVTAAVVGGTAIAGAAASASSSGKKTSTSTSSNTPWAPQGDQLQYAFGQARDIYDNAQNLPAWEATNSTTAATTQAGATGLTGQTGALSTAQTLAANGMSDNSAQMQVGIGTFYNTDQVTAAQQAARDDITNTLSTKTLPSLNAQAMSGGNVNSARAGAAESVARGEAARAIATSDANISTQAYNTAVNAALTNQAQQNSLALQGNSQASSTAGALSTLGESQRQANQNTQLQAATTLGSQDTANRSLDAQTKLSANGQLGTAIGLGYQGAQLGSDLTTSNANAIISQGDAQQAEEQRQITEAQQQYYAQENRDKQNLADYYGIVGSGNWGGTSSSSSTTPGTSSLAAGLTGALGGAATGYGMTQSGGVLSGIGKTTAPASYRPNSTSDLGALSVADLSRGYTFR